MKALSIRNLRKTYNNGFEALKGINLDVEEGDFFALLGPNGAGKSTAIGIISSLVNETSGSVTIFGHDLKTDRSRAKSCLGLVPQEVNFNQFDTVKSIVFNQAGYYGTPRKLALQRTEQCLKQMDLWDKRDTVSIDLPAQAPYLDVFSIMPYHARFGHASDPAWISQQTASLGQLLKLRGEPDESRRIWPIVQLADWGQPVPAEQIATVLDHATRPPATGVMVFHWSGISKEPSKIEALQAGYLGLL